MIRTTLLIVNNYKQLLAIIPHALKTTFSWSSPLQFPSPGDCFKKLKQSIVNNAIKRAIVRTYKQSNVVYIINRAKAQYTGGPKGCQVFSALIVIFMEVV